MLEEERINDLETEEFCNIAFPLTMLCFISSNFKIIND